MSKIRHIRFLAAAVQVHERTLAGVRHMVAPVTALVEGVHNELLYPATEIQQSAGSWEGVSLTVQHPVDADGSYVSVNSDNADSPIIVGEFRNVHYDPERRGLRGEVWINIEVAEEKAPEVLSILRGGDQLEVSTGLFTREDNVSGSWRGEDFISTLSDFAPDHLALLPGGEGACNWDDGCGVRANDDKTKEVVDPKLANGVRTVLMKPLERISQFVTNMKRTQADKVELKKTLAAYPQGLSMNNVLDALDVTGSSSDPDPKSNEASHDDIRVNLQRAIDSLDNSLFFHWVRDVFDDYFVYVAENRVEPESTMYRLGYKADSETGEVTISEDDPVEVRENREYVPVTNDAAPPDDADNSPVTNQEGVSMDKKKFISELIANKGNTFTEEDREWLSNLTECNLTKLKENTEGEATPEETVTDPPADDNNDAVADPPADKTADEYIDEIPNDEVRTMIRDGIEVNRKRKAELIEKIKANKKNAFTEEELEAMEITALENICQFANIEVNYGGQNPAPKVNTDDADETTMPPPNTFLKNEKEEGDKKGDEGDRQTA